MINVRSIRSLVDGDGMTLKAGKKIRYKTGFQVADYGIETRSANAAMKAVKAMKGNCGVWYENGIYYVDHSFRVSTKKEAIYLGRMYEQISVYSWKNGKCYYCKD